MGHYLHVHVKVIQLPIWCSILGILGNVYSHRYVRGCASVSQCGNLMRFILGQIEGGQQNLLE